MANIPSARKRAIYVKTGVGANDAAFTRLTTRTAISWSSKRDEAKEDYQDADVKQSYMGSRDVTCSLSVSRTKDDDAYDALEVAHHAGEAIEIQERDAEGKIIYETTVNVLEWKLDHGLNESSKASLTLSIAGEFTINSPARAAVTA